MRRTVSLCVTLLPLLAGVGTASAGAPDFDRDVATILAGRCFDCHNAAEHKGGLNLTTKATAMAGGEDGPVVVPGKPQDSPLWKNVKSNEMPPKHPLPEEEKETLRKWIESGAAWGTDPIDPFRFTTAKRAGRDWWAIQPVKRPAVPTPADAKRVRNPIDAYVLAELEKQRLAPSPEADKRTLIRRLTFDLTGLPPTPEQVDAFLKDETPDAYDKVVDRLLASPAYGVRFARLWLDLARFGESHGFERDQLRPNAWRYRDWVVGALNADLPYDRFVKMQLAGDLIAPNTVDGIAATGFLVAAAYDEVGNGQQSAAMRAVVRQDELEDMVGTVAQTFLGLTANCARCHDHKFDPISQKEYYQLASALAGVKHGERDLPADTVKSAADELTKPLLARQQQIEKELAAMEKPARERWQAGVTPRLQEDPPKPIAAWKFSKGFEDDLGSLNLKPSGKGVTIRDGVLHLDGNTHLASAPLQADLSAKTLEAWVSLQNLKQRGGGVIGVQSLDGTVFDTITFAEREPARWMAGSDHYKRYASFDGPDETQTDGFVHVAITYAADGTITAYRNGVPYGKPYKPNAPAVTFAAGKAQVIIGVRHTAGGGKLAGVVREARLYDRALTSKEIAASAGVQPGPSAADIEASLTSAEREKREQLQYELKAIRKLQTRSGVSKTYADVPTAAPVINLLLRGNPTKPAGEVAPMGLAALVGVDADFGLKPNAPDTDRRLKLADWIATDRNPLFARVIVNRLWQSHFGAGIVDSPNDFGFNGGRPTHPALLDWLASEIAEHGWSQKHIHRLIVTSATYRQTSLPRDDAMKADAGNRWLWRMTPRRIEAEPLRDAMLAVAGELNPTIGGPGFEDFYTFTNNSTFYEFRDYVGPTFNRRSLYRTWVRSGRSPLLDVFDCPDPSTKTPRRAVTTTPLQALSLMNNSLVLRMSEKLAKRAKQSGGQELEKQVREVYRLSLVREPTDEELSDTKAFVGQHGLPAFCRVMLNSSEFVIVD